MSARAVIHCCGIGGLLVSLVGLAGCGDGGGEPLPPTGGAGIPGVRGPAAPDMSKGAPGQASPGTPKANPSPP